MPPCLTVLLLMLLALCFSLPGQTTWEVGSRQKEDKGEEAGCPGQVL